MKVAAFILFSCFIMLQNGGIYHDNSARNKKIELGSATEKKLDFQKDVLPVLVQNCSPCHFPGGKMYDKLPFDKEATILNNAERILKRVEKDEKKKVVKDFILQHTADQAAAKVGLDPSEH